MSFFWNKRVFVNNFSLSFSQNNYPDEAAPEPYIRRRTSSCPDLPTFRPYEPSQRKRAQSLFYPNPENDPDFAQIHRGYSDTDLTNAERTQPQNEGGVNDPTDLLARVLAALGNIKAADDEAQSIAAMSCGAYNGFSDAQILASERANDSNWSTQYSDNQFSLPPPRARGRAASDFRAPIPDELEYGSSHDWTWSGDDQQIEEFMRLRRLNKRKAPNLYRTALTLPKSNSSHAVNIDDANTLSVTGAGVPRTERSQSIFDRLNPFKRRGDAQSRKQSLQPDSLQNYLEQTAAGRGSRMNAASPPPPPSNPLHSLFAPSMKRRASTYSAFSTNDDSNANVLENTTIADLIRALEVMHTQALTADDPVIDNFLTVPAMPRSRSHTVSESYAQPQQQQHVLPSINILPTTPTDRRASLRPFSTSNTPLFNRANRRVSTNLDFPSNRRSSLLTPPSSNGPPPYSENTPRPTHRRFSIRPTLLSIPPGQSPMPSIQAVSSLQKKLSTRPSPLSLTDYGTLNMRPNRTGRTLSSSSSNYGGGGASSVDSTLTAMPVSSHSTHLSPLNESRPSVVPTSRPSIQVFNPNANLDSKTNDTN